MKKLYNFKSNSIKKLKRIIKYLDFKKMMKAEYSLSVIIVVVIIVSICTNVAWSKRGSINYFFREAKQKIRLFSDFKKPVISDVNVSDISKHNAKIAWKTNKLTKTKLYLGTDTDYTLWQESFNRLSYDHWLNKIPNLEQGTTYHFKIVAIDRKGNKTECDDYAFDTLGDKDVLIATSGDGELISDGMINDSNQNLIKQADDTENVVEKTKEITHKELILESEEAIPTTNSNIKTNKIEELAYLDLNKPYVSKTGIMVTVTNIEKVEETGSYKYIISYKQENKTADKELDEGTFKIFFKDNTGLNQYGSFDKIFPDESIAKTYTFQILKTQKPFCVEFNNDTDAGLEGSFFRNQPTTDTLRWKIE